MAYGKCSYRFGHTPTALEQMLTEITYHRTREIRQYSREDSGFVLLNPTTFWTDLFIRQFLCYSDDTVRDDLLFFIRKKPKKTSAKCIPQFETHVQVFRKDSKKLPIGDTDVDWEETVYLNLIIQQFDYTLTCAICTRTSSKDLQILKRHSQRVYACPSRRSMECKGEMEEITYPNIFFMVDNYDEVFQDVLVHDGEMVCVELVATDREGTLQGVIFLGSIRYEALKRVYDARASLSTRMAQKMSLGWYQGSGQQRLEFVRMRGPQGKGHAEMAVTKQKGCGAETPTSEPGIPITELDWEETEEYPYMQRRMSDPSANLKNYVRGGNWKTQKEMKKSRSENEGVDSCTDGVNEIEAGDVRDVVVPVYQMPKSLSSVDLRKTKTDQKSLKCKVVVPVYQMPKSVSSMDLRKTKTDQKSLKHKELDDTTYNRLWTMRGFGQAYHFWKESRRANSPALNAYLTYVTLPWHHIIADLLDMRQEPILTF